VNPRISWGMSHIIEKCTMENPQQRYQSMEEVIYQLRHIRQIGKWKKGKEWSVVFISFLGKCIAAIAALLLAYQYETSGRSVFLYGFILVFVVLLIACDKKRFTMYEIRRDIFCGSGKKILYIWGFAMALISTLHITAYAQKQREENTEINCVDEDAELKAVLYDDLGRKILIKAGTCWEAKKDIIISIPIEEISNQEGEVVISYTDDKFKEKKYSFKCYRK